LPALEAARIALDDLDRNDVTEIRPVLASWLTNFKSFKLMAMFAK
jgi:hypothetical protein